MTSARVCIIGAGLSGLTAAYRLTLQGIPCDIYEASDRVGGRAWTETFSNGQYFELGGEFIDSNHDSIISLCRELGLSLIKANPCDDKTSYQVFDYYKPGNPLVFYTEEELFEDYKKVLPQVQADAKAAWPSGTKFNPSNEKAQELDRLSINEYLKQVCSVLDSVNPERTKFAQLMRNAYTTEYGESTEKQSALNFVFLFGYGSSDKVSLYGSSDEIYNIQGGTSVLVNALYSRILGTQLGKVFINSPLKKLVRYPGKRGKYEVTVGNTVIIYDAVLLTMSFEAYSTFDYDNAQFSVLKQYIIKNVKLGNSSKLNIQLQSPPIPEGYSGEGYNPLYQNCWNVTLDQPPVSTTILCNFKGGDQASKLDPSAFLRELDTTFPGISNTNIVDYSTIEWACQPWVKGGYTCYTIGQYCGGTAKLSSSGGIIPGDGTGNIRFVVPVAGREGESEPASLPPAFRNCFFSGEGTTIDWQGWLNGATQTGEDVAVEIKKFLS